MAKISYARAIQDAIREEMRRDPNVYLMGQDVNFSFWGTSSKEMYNEFSDRIFNAPIGENGFCASAIGTCWLGYRPIIELMFDDFILLSMDAIANQAAKYAYQSGPEFTVPVVYRAAGTGIGGSFGLHHAQFGESWLLNFPGLYVLTPSNPSDAKNLMKTAIRCNSPVVFYEHKTMYAMMDDVVDEEIPIGKAKVVKEGSDVTIVSFATGIMKALNAAKKLEEEDIDAEILDLRSLKPIDKAAIINSVKKTGHLVTVEDGCKYFGVGTLVAAIVAEEAIEYLDGPVLRVAAYDTVIPAGKINEKMVIPSEEDICNAVRKLCR